MDRYFQWTTADECDYVRGLGGWHCHERRPRMDTARRRQMLRAYLAAMPGRADWGEVDREAVLAEVGQQLRALEDRG